MWEDGKQPYLVTENVNQELLKLKGFLGEKEAQRNLVKFLQANIGFTCQIISDFDLFPFQEMAIKMMMKRDYCLFVWSRGLSKSTSAAVFAYLHAIFQPGAKIAIISASFRQSRLLFNTIEEIIYGKNASLLAECLVGSPAHRNDEWSMKIGTSEIRALPLGQGEKLRGFRFNCLLIDEYLLMPPKALNEVILPFLSVNTDPRKRQQIYEQESKLIEDGLMGEDERTQFPNPKMIGLSSASYSFEHLYETYKNYKHAILQGANEDGSPLEGTYGIMQMSYDCAPTQLYSKSLIENAKNNMSPQQFKREFGAQFSDDSEGFFNRKALENCTYKQFPCVEIKGDPNAKYLLAIDPSWSQRKDSDYFAMSVFKLMDDGKYLLVHCYAVNGGEEKNHIKYIAYLLEQFNIVFIIGDNAGIIQLMSSCNESKLFSDKKIKLEFLKDINLNDDKDYQGQLKEAKKQYSPTSGTVAQTQGRIIYAQIFSNDWIRKTAERLQSDIANKRVLFAANAQDKDYNTAISQDINIKEIEFVEDDDEKKDQDTILNKYSGAKERLKSKQIDLVDRQGFLVTLTKNQTGMMEPKYLESSGQFRLVLPKDIQKSGEGKARKDLFTTLLIGCAGVMYYNDFVNKKEEKRQAFIPTVIRG